MAQNSPTMLKAPGSIPSIKKKEGRGVKSEGRKKEKIKGWREDDSVGKVPATKA